MGGGRRQGWWGMAGCGAAHRRQAGAAGWQGLGAQGGSRQPPASAGSDSPRAAAAAAPAPPHLRGARGRHVPGPRARKVERGGHAAQRQEGPAVGAQVDGTEEKILGIGVGLRRQRVRAAPGLHQRVVVEVEAVRPLRARGREGQRGWAGQGPGREAAGSALRRPHREGRAAPSGTLARTRPPQPSQPMGRAAGVPWPPGPGARAAPAALAGPPRRAAR